MLKGILVKPNENPAVIDFENDHHAINKLIDGYMEMLLVKMDESGRGIYLIFNEDGKYLKLLLNKALVQNGMIIDTIVGNIICIASEGSELVSLTENEIQKYMKILSNKYIGI